MDAQRLVALDHGSYRTRIPGREQTVVIDKCRRWAAATGVIKLEGAGDNPRLTLQLTDVDTDRIVEQAQAEDNDGNRRRKIRELLFEEFGLPKEEAQQLFYRYRFRWRGTDRECELQYANVREQAFDTFKNKADQRRVIIVFRSTNRRTVRRATSRGYSSSAMKTRKATGPWYGSPRS